MKVKYINVTAVTLCMLGNFSYFCYHGYCLLTLFKINLFKILVQEHCQSFKPFGSRSGPMFCLS